ncbi:Putative F0F1-ATPase subunit Ca2+/Mg2+ transporter [Arachidicoccus rhizosphaerae]|uniref:Putative F0F1-ATPase subunit Ca2+/Mg2+ transporter n=1 Tax=Arachidicoccus rhizosphaerae TaxID=551991 RepID=A0A1H4B9B3_9BACT|nr:AtpZ/AtpI family protein [Arachidicoccus rhizosphaerae]SEA44548.1 Putative F0F1-ATPase subunit Ca2+/Mg2+ transporter [Arachidicoccus rhizosphaerae]
MNLNNPQHTSDKKTNNKARFSGNWMRYLSYGIQLMATIGIGLFIGYKLDEVLKVKFPLLVWLLPTVLLIYMLVKLVKDFSKNGKQ